MKSIIRIITIITLVFTISNLNAESKTLWNQYISDITFKDILKDKIDILENLNAEENESKFKDYAMLRLEGLRNNGKYDSKKIEINIKKNPEFEYNYLLRGINAQNSGKFKECLNQINIAKKNASSLDLRFQVLEADCYFGDRNYATSEKLYKDIVTKNKGFDFYKISEGFSKYNLGDVNGGCDLIHQAKIAGFESPSYKKDLCGELESYQSNFFVISSENCYKVNNLFRWKLKEECTEKMNNGKIQILDCNSSKNKLFSNVGNMVITSDEDACVATVTIMRDNKNK